MECKAADQDGRGDCDDLCGGRYAAGAVVQYCMADCARSVQPCWLAIDETGMTRDEIDAAYKACKDREQACVSAC